MKSIKRKGFTLVELLIVIVVIGILAAMMMLSSTEAVSSARANNIISNLRNLRTAALAWYTDNVDKVNGEGMILGNNGKYDAFFGKAETVSIKDILKYLGTTELNVSGSDKIDQMLAAKDSSGGLYALDYANSGKQWYVVYKIPNDDANIKQKLEARAKSIGLQRSQPGKGDTNRGDYSATAEGSQYPAMLIIDFEAK